ncbi:sensor histidine kinase [Caenimonas terrae]|uniref:histidine kinase n=1 Tax=Caenimonas terrae TaxID=696074 RepID=A0ABW0NC18_9BURK
MYRFLTNNRDELIARCKAKVAKRPRRAATSEQLRNGVPMFLEQLTRTLRAEDDGEAWESLKISGSSGGDVASLSELGVTATAHGKELLQLGYTIDQVVHDYGDLCQAITDMAVERDAPFSVDEFRTLNRCLDNAIADAVTSFSVQRDADILVKHTVEANQRLAVVVHELRTSAQVATLAVSALERGGLPISGATGGVLKRSLAAVTSLIDRTLSDVLLTNSVLMEGERFSVALLVAEAREGAALDASSAGSDLTVCEVDPLLGVEGNRAHLLAALAHLLRNAFKYTLPDTEVILHAYAVGNRVVIDVTDHCGGLSAAEAKTMFTPFSQRSGDQIDRGLRLSIARESVEADGGVMSVRDVPGTGCVFTIDLPRCALQAATDMRVTH